MLRASVLSYKSSSIAPDFTASCLMQFAVAASAKRHWRSRPLLHCYLRPYTSRSAVTCWLVTCKLLQCYITFCRLCVCLQHWSCGVCSCIMVRFITKCQLKIFFGRRTEFFQEFIAMPGKTGKMGPLFCVLFLRLQRMPMRVVPSCRSNNASWRGLRKTLIYILPQFCLCIKTTTK